MTIPNRIEQGNGVNMFVTLWHAFVLGSVCLVLLGIEMVLISLQTFPLLRIKGLHFGRVEIILFCTFVGNFAFIKVNSENKYVQLTPTIAANWDHIYFLLIKRKDFYQICHSTLSLIKFVSSRLRNPILYFQIAAISNDVPPSPSPSPPPPKTKCCFFSLKFYLRIPYHANLKNITVNAVLIQLTRQKFLHV